VRIKVVCGEKADLVELAMEAEECLAMAILNSEYILIRGRIEGLVPLVSIIKGYELWSRTCFLRRTF
jgi:hypothetical protein